MDAGTAVSAALVPSREIYRRELTEMARQDDRILCLEADLGGQRHPFADAHPDRFFNLGIAEAAMIDIAVSLASAGYRPFVSTFATFAVLRAGESMKLGLGYLGAPVTIVAPYAGVSGGWLGTTHHCLEDFAVVQSMPGIALAAPYGADETRAVLHNALAEGRPHYIRLGRNQGYESLAGDRPSPDFVTWDHEGDGETCLVSVGEKGTELSLLAVAEQPTLSHAHLCYLDQGALAKAARHLSPKAERFVVVEEHRPGGSVAAALALLLPDREVCSVSAGEGWVSSGGSHDDILRQLGMTLPALLAVANRN
ncbi:transketolase [Micromonospora sp. NPDC048835]|uniref:transketolase n=1 Tax=Micromonospora sp. NPDC048835 TaxID=3155147 RepID=UPI0033ED5268